MGSSCCKRSEAEMPQKEEADEADSPRWTLSPVAQALQKLAINMYLKIDSQRPNQNIFFSPLSIASALALIETGASGKTREEILNLIRPESDRTECGKLYGTLQRKITEMEVGQLNIANSLFRDSRLAVDKTYLKNVREWLNTEILEAPFAKDSEKARDLINRWVSEKTAGKIPSLFGQLTEDEACILVNAVYMKMNWYLKFDVEKTKEKTFYKFGGNEEQKVPFMCCENPLYCRRDDLRAVHLPYAGRVFSMYIILPRRRDGVKDIEKQLSSHFLMELFTRVRTFGSRVFMHMPKFTSRCRTSLLPVFGQLGIRSLNELGRMSNDPRVKISDAVHEAYIKVDEKGTEAAAATGCRMQYVSFGAPQSPKEIIVDHPFLFFIVHEPTWSIVFMGKINFVENKE